MSGILKFVFLFAFTSAIAQQDFEFDYMLEYEYVFADGKPNSKMYWFVNSKDNSSRLMVWEDKDKLVLRLSSAGKVYYTKMPRDNFFVESIALRCPPTYRERKQLRKKDYTIIKKQDTIINTERFSHYLLKPVNEKKIKKDNLLPQHYIIAANADFESPFVSKTSPTFSIWEEYGNIPSGITREYYQLDDAGNKKDASYLIQTLKVKKYISVYKSCHSN